MKEIFYSIIVPVYNVEKYIERCLYSIIKQNFNDLEVIVVNDGSTDSSGILCKEICKKYNFITLIEQANQGLSGARNTGIKAAKGKYLIFIDSDDYIEIGSLQRIYEKIVETPRVPDVCFLDALKVYGKNILPINDGYRENKINGKKKEEVIKHLAELNKFPASACTKMINRKFCIQNNLYFEQGLLSEDVEWSIRSIIAANNYYYIKGNYYYYCQNREGSISNSISIKNIEGLMYSIKKYSNTTLGNTYQREINSMLSYEYMMAIMGVSKLDKNSRNIIVEEIRKYEWLLKYGKTFKTKITSWIVKIFGIKICSKMLNLYYNLRNKKNEKKNIIFNR